MSGLPPNLAQLLAAQQQPPQQPLAGLTALGQPAPPAPPGPPPGPPSLLPGGFPLLQPGAPQALYQQQQGALSVAQAAQTAIQNAQAKAQAQVHGKGPAFPGSPGGKANSFRLLWG
mmetsp:Transcript_66774/g.118169  ORF Transcript_66774/g.118169 Transcript_66774/m.118169 type:complete len:116 (-) Transcript_66774:279-626(-)